MITGLNHFTLAVSDLGVSFDFYVNLLGFKPRARWARGAYLSLGDLWLCLSCDDVPVDGASREDASRVQNYTHYAFSVSERELPLLAASLKSAGATQWKDNTSEGVSFYFLDPDGHQLELHAGDLQSRLASIEANPYDGLELFN